MKHIVSTVKDLNQYFVAYDTENQTCYLTKDTNLIAEIEDVDRGLEQASEECNIPIERFTVWTKS